MILHWINPSEVIASVFDEYNIKSSDFIQRTPDWINKVLQELKINKNLEPVIIQDTFSAYKYFIGPFVKKIDEVYLNTNIARYNNEFIVEASYVDSNKPVNTIGDINSNISIGINTDITKQVLDDKLNSYYYNVENSFIKTNLYSGHIKIMAHTMKGVLDDITGLFFPLIPDEVHTKNAIQCFILKTILMRGYVHPILNLRENNPFVNPALKYKIELDLARVAINSMNKAERKEARTPFIGLFGKENKLVLNQDDLNMDTYKIFENSRWINDGDSYCEIINGSNTGYLIQPQLKQIMRDGIWLDTLETRNDKTINLNACPINYIKIGYSFTNNTPAYTYVSGNGNNVAVITNTVEDTDKFLYLSVPINLDTVAFEGDTLSDSTQFEYIGNVTTPTGSTNKVYKSLNTIYLGFGVNFEITY